MEKFRPSGWLLLIVLLLFIFSSGCSTTESLLEGSKRATQSIYEKMAAPVTRVKRGKADGLTKKVLLLPLVDQARLGQAKVDEMTKTLIDLLEKGKGIRVTKSETPLPSAEKAESPRYGITIDPDRAKRAEEMGMNVLLTVTLNPFEFQKTKSGIWPFRSVKREVEISLSATALDIINGTLYLTHTESDKLRLLEDLMEWEEEEEEELRRNIDQAKLTRTLSRLLNDQASAIRAALVHEPWAGRIISADGENLVISGGKDVGLKEGKILEVYEKGEAIRSVNGKSIYLLGNKIGEIKTLTVREIDSSAAPLIDGSYRAGQVIRLKR